MMKDQQKVNILMVDDQPAKLLSYEVILKELDENLIKAQSGREALDHLLKTDVAVVLMDVSMPELDGFELADMIRQHPRFQKTAIIFISAVHLTDLDRLKAYQRGAVDYISVPIVPELLRAKVSIFADLHRKTRQLEMLNRDLRSLSARLMTSQDEERRRISRDLHDSAGQVVAAISMNNELALMEAEKLSPTAADALRQNAALVQQFSKEIRTISHLLHPALLDEIGLLPAIKSFADGFAERSKIEIALELAPEIGRLAPNVEISIFRIVQECLTNVYRHSGSKTARIKIWPSEETILTVQVCDQGKGIPPERRIPMSLGASHGGGVSGMRERVRELGGALEIQSDGNGTTVTAAFPIISAAVIDA
ncbi:MAG TPA: response regulator [Candidatus Acidoferrales bacterium]|nr:response regulator [Candidatus Acidoferrales bacterium]